ncbi:hypothetical protein BC629DRAFT_1526579 [Irpex lacteus]|nr:hypothetical protein BC629DRAFT_1526579 [Irpex lacteus]
MHETIHSTEDTFRSPGERRDSSHDGDGPKKLQPAGNPAELAEGPENLAAIVARQASEKGGAAPSVINSRTIPASLPTSARDETGLAEVQDGSEVTADDVQGYPISDCAASSLCDNAAGEDNSQRADNVAAAAGSSDTILRSNAEPDPDHARADIEADTGGQEQAAEVEAEARAAD